jgi:hypothetical protein
MNKSYIAIFYESLQRERKCIEGDQGINQAVQVETFMGPASNGMSRMLV